MKKITWITGIAAAAIFGLTALGAQESGAGLAVIREVQGRVEVKAPEDSEWRPAAAGQTVAVSSLISTGFDSTALLALGNSVLAVRPLTRLSIGELSALNGNERTGIELRAGRIRAEVTPPSGGTVDFTVRSPSVTASVRGTIFEFDGMNLETHEGRVHIVGSGGSGAYIAAGQRAGADIETGITASPAETLRAELAPAMPAGVAASSGGAITPVDPEWTPEPAGPPPTASVDAGFSWE
ncbi:MAG: FecR family protein [Spirochaetaceae bacterium]|jgi:hypothetical protein|nr:FecR family protein [Spirochaetaceae bacterium]